MRKEDDERRDVNATKQEDLARIILKIFLICDWIARLKLSISKVKSSSLDTSRGMRQSKEAICPVSTRSSGELLFGTNIEKATAAFFRSTSTMSRFLFPLCIAFHSLASVGCFPRPARTDVQKVMDLLETRYGRNATAWLKTKNYLYHQNDLVLSQVRSVIDFLDDEKLPTVAIVQQSPRILRTNVSTKLEPTYKFLVSLFGDQTITALQKNPDLLLTSKIGYQTPDNLALIEFCLKNELNWTEAMIERLRNKTPTIFQQPVSRFLAFLQALRDEYALDDSAITKLLLKQPTLSQLPLTALKRRLDAIGAKDVRRFFEPANAGVLCQSAESILQKVSIVGPVASSRHPPILGLSIENLRSKIDYFDQLHPELSNSVLRKCPSVMSLSLASIRAKVSFLCENLWKNSTIETGMQLCSSPTCLSISLERNLRPTVEFFHSTRHWNSSLITGRHLSASLYGRLIPRYQFNPKATLSELVFDSDADFCGGNYLEFKKSSSAKAAVNQARWQLWLKTGLPMSDD